MSQIETRSHTHVTCRDLSYLPKLQLHTENILALPLIVNAYIVWSLRYGCNKGALGLHNRLSAPSSMVFYAPHTSLKQRTLKPDYDCLASTGGVRRRAVVHLHPSQCSTLSDHHQAPLADTECAFLPYTYNAPSQAMETSHSRNHRSCPHALSQLSTACCHAVARRILRTI
jgi:hypothetical protein